MRIKLVSAALSIILASTACSSAFLTPNNKHNKFTGITYHLVASSSSSIDEHDNDGIMSAREARIFAPISAALTTASIASMGLTATPEPAKALIASPDFDTSVGTFFPGAVPNSLITFRVAAKLSKRNYKPFNTIMGSSLCSDEIDSTSSSLQQQLQKQLVLKNDGGVFNLGGLGGVPFVGRSGFRAFFSHVPVEGKVLILYGPHVGITNEGVVGKVERVGQSKPSTSCGAAMGAYNVIKIMGGRSVTDSFDYQEEFIIDELSPKLQMLLEQQKLSGAVNGVVNENTAIATLTCNMFDIVNDVMESQLDTVFAKPEFWNKVSEVTLLGGIVINRGHGAGLVGGDDLFQPLQFKALNADGEVDMWDQVFGDLRRTKYT